MKFVLTSQKKLNNQKTTRCTALSATLMCMCEQQENRELCCSDYFLFSNLINVITVQRSTININDVSPFVSLIQQWNINTVYSYVWVILL